MYPTRCNVTKFILSGNCVRHPQHTQTSSNSSTIAADGNKGGTPDAVDTVVCAPDDG